MSVFYSLRINLHSKINSQDVDKILNVITDFDLITWVLEKDNTDSEIFYDYIKYFLDLLEEKYDKLCEFGIKNNDISIWYLYEYEEQCNMEFSPLNLKRMGENGITLCISCWEK